MLKHCVSIFGVPFYVVQFTDFFLGDQLTSHNQTMVDLVHVISILVSCWFWDACSLQLRFCLLRMSTYRSLRLSSSFSSFGLHFSPHSSVSFNVFGVFTTLSSEFESNGIDS